jgi:hypothetical protein
MGRYFPVSVRISAGVQRDNVIIIINVTRVVTERHDAGTVE